MSLDRELGEAVAPEEWLEGDFERELLQDRPARPGQTIDSSRWVRYSFGVSLATGVLILATPRRAAWLAVFGCYLVGMAVCLALARFFRTRPRPSVPRVTVDGGVPTTVIARSSRDFYVGVAMTAMWCAMVVGWLIRLAADGLWISASPTDVFKSLAALAVVVALSPAGMLVGVACRAYVVPGLWLTPHWVGWRYFGSHITLAWDDVERVVPGRTSPFLVVVPRDGRRAQQVFRAGPWRGRSKLRIRELVVGTIDLRLDRETLSQVIELYARHPELRRELGHVSSLARLAALAEAAAAAPPIATRAPTGERFPSESLHADPRPLWHERGQSRLLREGNFDPIAGYASWAAILSGSTCLAASPFSPAPLAFRVAGVMLLFAAVARVIGRYLRDRLRPPRPTVRTGRRDGAATVIAHRDPEFVANIAAAGAIGLGCLTLAIIHARQPLTVLAYLPFAIWGLGLFVAALTGRWVAGGLWLDPHQVAYRYRGSEITLAWDDIVDVVRSLDDSSVEIVPRAHASARQRFLAGPWRGRARTHLPSIIVATRGLALGPTAIQEVIDLYRRVPALRPELGTAQSLARRTLFTDPTRMSDWPW